MKKSISITQKETVSGRVRCQVVDSKTGKVKRDYGWQKNLILNQGLDQLTTTSWNDLFRYCVAGTGTTDTQTDSSDTVAGQSGTTVTLTGSSFAFTNTITDAGRYIKWDTGEEARIVSVTSSTQAEVHISQSVPNAEFTFFLTNQTAMTAESARTLTCLIGVGNTDIDRTNIATGIRIARRTFDFTPVAAPITYNEVGLSWSATVAANLFSRIKLTSGVPLVVDDVFRVVYELSFFLTPYTPTAASVTITGWGTLDGILMKGNDGLSGFHATSAGAVLNHTYYAIDELAAGSECWLSTLNPAQPSTMQIFQGFSEGSGSTFAVKGLVNSGYTSLSFTITKTATFLPAEGNLTGITDIMVCRRSSGTVYAGTWFKLTVPQTKDNTHTLVVNFIYVWGRVL